MLVEHVSVVKKNVRPNPQKQIKGGIAEQEVADCDQQRLLVCGTCGPVRVRHEVRGDKKVRVCAKCGTTLDKRQVTSPKPSRIRPVQLTTSRNGSHPGTVRESEARTWQQRKQKTRRPKQPAKPAAGKKARAKLPRLPSPARQAGAPEAEQCGLGALAHKYFEELRPALLKELA